MYKIYHVCDIGNPDGSRVVIGEDEECLTPTTDCFCKDPQDAINSVKTCSRTEKQKIIFWRSTLNYFNKKKKCRTLYNRLNMKNFVSINKKLLDETLLVLFFFNKNPARNKQRNSVG